MRLWTFALVAICSASCGWVGLDLLPEEGGDTDAFAVMPGTDSVTNTQPRDDTNPADPQDTDTSPYSDTRTSVVDTQTDADTQVIGDSQTSIDTQTSVGTQTHSDTTTTGLDTATGMTSETTADTDTVIVDTDSACDESIAFYPDCDGDGAFSGLKILACDPVGAAEVFDCADGNDPDGGWSNVPGTDCDDDSVGEATCWYDDAWSYRSKIAILSARVTGTNQFFPVLIRTNSAAWKWSGVGGHVGQNDGGDFVFTGDDGLEKLSHAKSRSPCG